MFDVAKEILNIFEDNNYKAFIVGGFVRDKILNIKSKDIDICTNATPDEVSKLFNNVTILSEYGATKIRYKNYYYDITTFRKDIKYGNNRKELVIKYASSIYEDVTRRDFTINSLYMDKEENIYDIVNSRKDIDDGIIRVNGIIGEKISEDPIRILRAVRYAIKLNFKIDDELIKFINKNKNLLNNLSYYRKKEELDKIFEINNLIYFEELINKLDIKDELGIRYNELKWCAEKLGIWSQIDFSDRYPFSKKELKDINDIKNIVNSKVIDSYTVYNYGIEVCLIAAEIMNIDEDIVHNMHKNLLIRKSSDLCISFNDVKEISNLSIIDSKELYNDIIKKVLNNELKNDKNIIENYIEQSR